MSSMMTILEIQSYLEAIGKNTSLHEEKNFDVRMEVIDFIEFQVMGQVEELQRKSTQSDKLVSLKLRGEKVKSELEEININLFQKLRTKVQAGEYTGKEFRDLVIEYVDIKIDDHTHLQEPGYDNLDVFINGLCHFLEMPDQTKDLEPEMVYYQKTPARIVFELVEKAHFVKEDVFFDLGSGLGQVTILINLLTGITTKGVEFEPAFCDYARDCATKLNLSNVTFINADARKTDYSEGTIFFMFTPFTGEILQEVLEMLRRESLLRRIKIITYGPCTAQVALESWLEFEAPKDNGIYKMSVFTSF